MSESTYKIIRMFQEDDRRPVIKKGLTLEEAQEHCRDSETSSRTCTKKHLVEMTRQLGPWFDGFEEE